MRGSHPPQAIRSPLSTPAASPTPGGEITLQAPAKINLTLEVLCRRADGYHDIASIIQTIDLFDLVRVRVTPGSGIHLQARGAPVPAGEANLAWKAAAAWLAADQEQTSGSATGDEGRRSAALSVEIDLDKRIPVGAGLGGGSADAAAVLLALDSLVGRLGASTLYRLASDIGSDVPLFLAGGTCLITGRGERLRRLPPLFPFWVVLVTPDATVETPWAYAARSEQELTATGASTRMLESAIRERNRVLIGRHLVNDLERVVARRYMVVAEVLEILRQAGTIGACMSGSGSSAFALIEDRGDAMRLADILRRLNHPVHVCRPFRGGPTRAAAGKGPESTPGE